MSNPSSRIGGDFNYEAMEAFRSAYAQQLQSPDEDAIANNSGLPTDTIPNTSPWFNQIGLWKANDGRSIDYKNKTPFNPEVYYTGEEEDEEEGEEFDKIVDEITNKTEE